MSRSILFFGLCLIACNFERGTGQRPAFNILPFYPYPQIQNDIFSYLPFQFQNNPRPQIQPTRPNNPTDESQQSSVANNNPNNFNGLASFFPFVNLNNQNSPFQFNTNPQSPVEIEKQTIPESIDGSNKAAATPIYTTLPFNFTRPQIMMMNPMKANKNMESLNSKEDSSSMPHSPDKTDMKDPKFFIPTINTQNASLSFIPITQLFG